MKIPKPKKVVLEGEEYKALCQRVFERDKWRCKNPRCAKTLPLQAHHIIKRSKIRLDVESNLCSLCAVCHEENHRGQLSILPTHHDLIRFTYKDGESICVPLNS